MPVEGVVLQCRPLSCQYCMPLYYATGHVSEEAARLGLDLHDMIGELDEQAPVLDAIHTLDPLMFTGAGHGSPDAFTSNTEKDVINLSNAYMLSDRIVYLLSCSTAAQLGPEAVRQGARSYGGYDRDWSWIQNDLTLDPYLDPYGEAFFRSSNEYPISLFEGKNAGEAHGSAFDSYSYWVEYWRTSTDGYAAEMMKWLLWDRDHLLTLGDLDARLTGPQQPSLGEFRYVKFWIDEDGSTLEFSWDWSGGSGFGYVLTITWYRADGTELGRMDREMPKKQNTVTQAAYADPQPGSDYAIFVWKQEGTGVEYGRKECTLTMHSFTNDLLDILDRYKLYIALGGGALLLGLMFFGRRRPTMPMIYPPYQPPAQPQVIVLKS